MRIGVVTTSYPRWSGDPAGSFVAGHVAWLRGAGHQVEVVAAGPVDELDEVDGVQVVRVAAPPGLFYSGGAPEALAESPWRFIAAARFTARMAATVLRHRQGWDRIIAHWLVPAGAVAAALARLSPLEPGRPVLAIAHSGDVHLLARTRLTGAVAGLLSARRARVVFVSHALRRRFIESLPRFLRAGFESAPVCAMGIDVARFRRLPRRRHQPPTVLFLGRLVPVKGGEVLVAAARAWSSQARVIIAGGGPEAGRLARLAAGADSISFAGEVDGAERDRLLAGADLLVVPSIEVEAGRTEGLPMVVLEAMAAGVPVVASRVGGLAELPADQITLIPPCDPAALAITVDQLLGDEVRRARLAAAGQSAVADRDWSVVGSRLMAELEAISPSV